MSDSHKSHLYHSHYNYMQYELLYLIGASQEAQTPEIKKEVEEAVTASEGVFQEKETVEKRRLSYKIKHENHGVYFCRRFELEEAEKIAEITKNLNLNTRILRFLISRTDDLPELKSKEERIEEAAKRDKNKDRKEIRPETKKVSPAEKEESTPAQKQADEKPAEKIAEKKEEPADETPKDEEKEIEEKSVEETKQSDEDIDKKLEEILNI